MIFYALDTNIISYFLKNDMSVVQKINEERSNHNKIIIPPVVYFEIQNWLMKNHSQSKMASFKKMYSEEGIGILDKDIFDIATAEKIKLQTKGLSIEDSDLWIAAYCLKHDMTLVTNNVKHFEYIPNLKIINWKE
jgi:predicted nucleic acid-binding protein